MSQRMFSCTGTNFSEDERPDGVNMTRPSYLRHRAESTQCFATTEEDATYVRSAATLFKLFRPTVQYRAAQNLTNGTLLPSLYLGWSYCESHPDLCEKALERKNGQQGSYPIELFDESVYVCQDDTAMANYIVRLKSD
jgi:hypothetical protein